MIFHLSSGRRLDGIAITTPPAKTSYYAGESFDPAGMVVTGTYNNTVTQAVTGYTISPAGALPAGTTAVTITYSEGGVTKTATQAITVTKQTVQVPTQTGSLTYNGSTQSPTWSNTAHINFSGTTSAANAGTYKPTAALADTALYQWPDGTTANKTLSWSIGKAAGSASASPSSVTLSSSATSASVTVNRAGDGAITASSSNTSVCTVSVSGTTVTITGLATGTATITINVAEGTNHTAASTSVGVSATFGATASTTATSGVTYTSGISALTPEKLTRYAQAISNNSAITNTTSTVYIDDGSDHYKISVGDAITVYFGSEARETKIMGLNHYDLTTATAYGEATATGKAGILFQTVDCLNTTYKMNSSNTNVGGWKSAALRTTMQGTIKNTLSSAWQSAIKSVVRTVGKGNAQNATEQVDDTLFLPTGIEVFGSSSVSYCADNEGTWWNWYQANNTAANRVKKTNGSVNSWWECSPRASNATYFNIVGGNGSAAGGYASNSVGVPPAWCV